MSYNSDTSLSIQKKNSYNETFPKDIASWENHSHLFLAYHKMIKSYRRLFWHLLLDGDTFAVFSFECKQFDEVI